MDESSASIYFKLCKDQSPFTSVCIIYTFDFHSARKPTSCISGKETGERP